MPSIRIAELRNSSVLRVYADRESIQKDPDYQRMGEVWTLEKRQLLIDTVLNELDMPKLYFHEFARAKTLEDGQVVKFAVIDGRQRLEAIYGFIEGLFALAEDFKYFEDSSIDAGGLTYADLGKVFPRLKTVLDSYVLPVTTVLTDDQDLIEEMFSRLNEAAPLNAAEKRNAMGGPMAQVIREVADHGFFGVRVPFSNKRYQHREVAAKFLLLCSSNSLGDTKKAYLDDMVQGFRREQKESEAREIGEEVRGILDWAQGIFVERDALLKTQAMAVIYFQVFREALDQGWADGIRREELVEFDEERRRNREAAEEEIAKATYELLEFDRMHLQGSNDKSSIEFRVRVLKEFLRAK